MKEPKRRDSFIPSEGLLLLKTHSLASLSPSLIAPVMSHRSFGSLASDAPLEGETSVQNVDQTQLDLDDDAHRSKRRLRDEDAEDGQKVQGFFGVTPWSIRLSPSVPAPIVDSTPGSGTLFHRFCQSHSQICFCTTVFEPSRLHIRLTCARKCCGNFRRPRSDLLGPSCSTRQHFHAH